MSMIYKKLFLILVLFISFLTAGAKVQAAADIDGWGWSDGIGWISFNCTNGDTTHTGPTGTCGTGTGLADYKVTFSTTTTTGTFSGYAWSSNVGWISFNAGDGTHPNVTTDLSTGLVTGWARALAGVGRTDGWDGWIRFSDTGDVSPKYPSGYVDGTRGITFDPAAGIFKGYAWGDTNVGWLTFSPSVGTPVNCEPTCGDPNPTSDLNFEISTDGLAWYSSTSITANAQDQATVIVKWDLENVSDVQIANNTNGAIDWPGITNVVPPVYSYNSKSFAGNNQTSITFTGITSTTVKKLQLSYRDNTLEKHYKEVSVIIYPNSVPPVLNCPTPTNAQLCPGSSYAPGASTINANIGLCSGTSASCEFYCPQGFKLVGNSCRRSGIISEQ